MGTQRGALVEEKFVVGHHDNVQHFFWYTCYLEYLQVYCKCAKCVKSLPVKKVSYGSKSTFFKIGNLARGSPYFAYEKTVYAHF